MIKLSEIIPQSLQDAQILSLCEGLDAWLAAVEAESELVLHLPRLDKLPHEVLDKLAWQYHVEFYKDSYPLSIKRDLIRQSFFAHRIKGTPAGVEKFLSNLMDKVKVTEWFDYDGKPYFFKITTSGLKIYLDDDSEFTRLIDEAKNLRSWLEAITFDLTLEEDHTYHVAQSISNAGIETTDFENVEQAADTLYHAVTELHGGKTFADLSNEVSLRGTIQSSVVELESGKEIVFADYEIDFDSFFYRMCRARWRKWKNNPVIEWYHHHNHDFDEPIPVDDSFEEKYFAAIEFEHGREITPADFEFDLPQYHTKYYAGLEMEHGREVVPADFSESIKPMREAKYFAGIELERGREITLADFYDDQDDFLTQDKDFLRLYFKFDSGYQRYLTVLHPKENLSKEEINLFADYVASRKILLNSSGELAKGISRATVFKRTLKQFTMEN